MSASNSRQLYNTTLSLPSAKRQRRDESENLEATTAILLSSLPNETLLSIFEYSNAQEMESLICVCSSWAKLISGATTFWKELALRCGGPVLQEVFQSLRPSSSDGQEVCVPTNSSTRTNVPVSCLDDAALWKRCIQGRDAAYRNTLQVGVDYHLVTEFGLPAPSIDRPVQRLTSEYSFVLHIWKKDGAKISTSLDLVSQTLQLFLGCICLNLGGRSSRSGSTCLGKIVQGDFEALQIEVSRRDTGTSSVLYSSSNQLSVYGGGSFEEYSALPWFEREEEWEGEWWEWGGELERDWLPFVEVIIPSSDGAAKTTTTCLRIEFQWRSRIPDYEFQYGPYRYVRPMTVGEVYTFLRHRTSMSFKCKVKSTSRDDGRVPRGNVLQVHHSLQDYTPRPLESYSFTLDITNTKDPISKSCSIFYPTLSDEPLLTDGSLEFEIPERYQNFLPPAEDNLNLFGDFVPVEIDMVFTVCVIDKRTGRHAMLYKSEVSCKQFYISFMLCNYIEFEKSAALTQFSFNGLHGKTIPVPAIRGWIHAASQEEWEDNREERELHGERKRSIDLYLGFISYTGVNPGTANAITRTPSHDNLLAFLEKGLVYK